jgi:hypothetical protein
MSDERIAAEALMNFAARRLLYSPSDGHLLVVGLGKGTCTVRLKLAMASSAGPR